MRHIEYAVAAVVTLVSLWLAAPASALNFIQPAGSPYGTGQLTTNSVRTGDINNDGRDDVFTANADYSASVFLSDANGSLTQASGSPISSASYALSGALGNLNGDGNLDMVLATNGSVAVRLGNGDGTFGAPAAYPTQSNGSDVAVADFTGDGNNDILVLGWSQNNVSLLVGVGDGTFGAPVQYPTANGPLSVVVGDFNEDSHPDFATANEQNAAGVMVMLNDGSGGFSQAPASPYVSHSQAQRITSGDFNDDGRADLAVAVRPSQAMLVLYGNGDGSFQPGMTIVPDSQWSNSVASADFDGDDFDDVVLGMSTNISDPIVQSAPVYLGNATNTLIESPDGPWAATSPAYPWVVATGDFNDDGHPDWVAGDQGGRISVFINDVTPGISITPSEHDFGMVGVFSSGTPQAFTIESTGTTQLDISSVALTGVGANQFAIDSNDCGASLQPGEDCEVTVNFEPDSPGLKLASLTLATNAPNSPQASVFWGNAQFPGVTVTPEQVDFGPVPLNDGPSAAETVTIGTIGVNLEIEEVSIYTNDFEDFSITSDDCTGKTIEPGETCEVDIVFEPGALGERNAMLRIEHLSGVAIFPVEGEGVANPSWAITPGAHDFGTRLTDEGLGAPQVFTLTSSGTTDLETSTVSLSGPAADQFRITADGCSNRTLAPQASCEISVAFAPATAGEKVADLHIATNVAGGPANARVTGSGQDPVPPPDPCEPVAVRKIANFTPSVKKRSNIPGVRARITTTGPAVVRISSKVIYRVNGKQGQFREKQRQFAVTADSVKYKVAIPKKLRKKLKPKKQVRFVITYASKGADPECTKFGEKKTRNLTTRVARIIPNG